MATDVVWRVVSSMYTERGTRAVEESDSSKTAGGLRGLLGSGIDFAVFSEDADFCAVVDCDFWFLGLYRLPWYFCASLMQL
jgi:hypothetical protein